MRFRPFDLKLPLALWNLALAVVSAIGAFRVGSHMLYLLSSVGGYSFRDTICECVRFLFWIGRGSPTCQLLTLILTPCIPPDPQAARGVVRRQRHGPVVRRLYRLEAAGAG